MNQKTFNNRKGQMLIELMVALGVLTIGFLGMVSLLSKAVGLNRTISENYQATYLAAEGIEVVKNLLDANLLQSRPWNDKFAVPISYELQFDSNWEEDAKKPREVPDAPNDLLNITTKDGVFAYVQDLSWSPTPFTREVKITPRGASSNEIQVNSIVRWTSRGGGKFETNIEDHFYNWR